MARTKGSFSLAGAIEPKAAAPLDARSTVKTMAELTDANSFPYSYIGMSVFVTDPTVLKEYVLIGADTTVLANWREQGSGSSESPIIMNYATYQALPTETKNDGKVRYIPDYPSSGGGSDQNKADLTVIAPAFDATESYAIGGVVTYNGKVYIFTDEHTGDWDSEDVDETDVSELTEEMSAAEVQAVKDAYDATALQTGAFASTFDIIDLRGTERIVGKLIESDGTVKPIYEKTVVFSSALDLTANGWTNTDIDSSSMDCIVSAKAIHNSRTVATCLKVGPNGTGNKVEIFNASSSFSINRLILQYTKTTT